MKKISNLLSALALSAALCLGCTSAAFASTVVFEGPDAPSAFSVEGGTGYHATDLFENLKNAMPGDSLAQDVTIENAHSRAVELYLAAVAHDEEGNPLQYSEPFEDADGKDQGKNPEASDTIGGEGERDETVATMADFLAQLTMRVYSGSELLYEGSPEGMAAASLGALAPGASLTLKVELEVPPSLGNEYAYRVGEVDWVITVSEIVSPAPPADPDTPDTPADPDDPDAPLPDTGDDSKEPEQGGAMGQTGDTAPLALLACISVASALVVLFVAFARKRQR